jgi:hypothetical protein
LIEFCPKRSEANVLHEKPEPTKRKRRRKALPALGAAGLSLSLASAASAAAVGGHTADLLTQNIGVSHETNLAEEEISDVSLATFYVFDDDGAATSRRGVRLTMGCGGCAGCAGCSGCSSSDYQATTTPTWNNAGALSVTPARRAVRTQKRTSGHRNP